MEASVRAYLEATIDDVLARGELLPPSERRALTRAVADAIERLVQPERDLVGCGVAAGPPDPAVARRWQEEDMARSLFMRLIDPSLGLAANRQLAETAVDCAIAFYAALDESRKA